MRLLVRATTIRAPTGPDQPRIYGIGRDRDSGAATASEDLFLLASGSDNDQGYARISDAPQHLPAYGTTGDYGYATWDDPSTETAIGRDRDRGYGTWLPNNGINYGRDRDRGYGTWLPNNGINYGRDRDSGSATVRRVYPGTDRDRGYAVPGIRARGASGDTGRATGSAAIAYAYTRTIVVERMADPNLAALTATNYVLSLALTDTWLKQSSLTGGRIRHDSAYDLIFETATSVRLDHEIDAYDGTAGRGDFRIRLPSWAVTTDQFILRVRYGADL
jgi:hypothetical protein